MDRGEAQCLNEGGGVIGHVVERVGHVGLAAFGYGFRVRRVVGDDPVELLAETHVAVVEADDTEAAVGEPAVIGIRPRCHLRAEALDDDQGASIFRARHFVADVDAVGADHAGHGLCFLAQARPSTSLTKPPISRR